MRIAATFEIDVDVEGWAKARKITRDEAEAEVFAYIGGMDLVAGQTFATQVSATVIEES